MVHAAVPLQAGNGGSRLAKARERFLAAIPIPRPPWPGRPSRY